MNEPVFNVTLLQFPETTSAEMQMSRCMFFGVQAGHSRFGRQSFYFVASVVNAARAPGVSLALRLSPPDRPYCILKPDQRHQNTFSSAEADCLHLPRSLSPSPSLSPLCRRAKTTATTTAEFWNVFIKGLKCLQERGLNHSTV